MWADLEEIPVEVHIELAVVSEVESQFPLRIRVHVLPENVPVKQRRHFKNLRSSKVFEFILNSHNTIQSTTWRKIVMLITAIVCFKFSFWDKNFTKLNFRSFSP
jgi:hypothetical protein